MSPDDAALDNATIATLLRYFRKRQEWSQRQLADASGLSDGLIGNVERGTRNLGIESVHQVADALELDDDDRERLLAARKRYADEQIEGRRRPGEPSPWDLVLEGQRQITEALSDLREILLDERRGRS